MTDKEYVERRLTNAGWHPIHHLETDEWRPSGRANELVQIILPLDEDEDTLAYEDKVHAAVSMVDSLLGPDMSLPVTLNGKKFGQRLDMLITKRHVSRRLLAAIAGVANPIVTHWIEGASFPNALQLQRICDALDVSADSLIGIDGRTWKEFSK